MKPLQDIDQTRGHLHPGNMNGIIRLGTISKIIGKIIAVFKRILLHRIVRVINVNGQWRRRTNKEMYEMSGEPDTQINRLRWAGHVARMSGIILKDCWVEVSNFFQG